MPVIHINGQPVQAKDNQTVLEAALENGHYIPYFCWHPKLSIAGNCRLCVVQVEGRNWVEISCNMPVAEGLKVLTDSELVKAHRKATLQFITLNHPVDCGICDKAGECTLQDYHFQYNGEQSISFEPKVQGTKYFDLGERIVLDNERCILCSRCVRFTREISKSHALGIVDRGDHSLVRPAGGENLLNQDPYSENLTDICPVGALLSRKFMYKSRVWYLKQTPSVCPGCERGCTVNLWHRKDEWAQRAPDADNRNEISRVTPLENDDVNGHWICNKGRDLGEFFDRRRAEQPLLKGKVADLAHALDAARALIAAARKPVALVSSWASNEELAAFNAALGSKMSCFVRQDCQPADGERVQDDLLIRADKNPNGRAAREMFGDAPARFEQGTDLVLVWGEGHDFTALPVGAKIVLLNAWLAPENGHADVFFPISAQTERDGHYTNFEGKVSAFKACFGKLPTMVHAQAVFEALAAPGGSRT